MSTPLFFPVAAIVSKVDTRAALTLRELLARAGVACRASGRWTERLVCIRHDTDAIRREPGDWGAVSIGVPASLSRQEQARYAAAAMAYGLMDLVARQSLKGASWARPAAPKGRPSTGTAKSNAERQRALRARRSD